MDRTQFDTQRQFDTSVKLADTAQSFFDGSIAVGITYDAGDFFVGFAKDREGKAQFVTASPFQWVVEAAVARQCEWLAR